MRPGLVSISFRQLDHKEIIKAAAGSKLEGIEWGGDVHVPHGNLRLAEEVGRQTRDAGLEVASYGSYYRFAECEPDGSTDGPSIKEVIDTAEALGAPAIRVWAGNCSPQSIPEEQWKAIVEHARLFAEEASCRQMRLDFEFHEKTLTETPESTLRLLRGIDHPAARTLWQPPLHTSPEARLEGLRTVKPWVSNVHCNYFGQDSWPHVHLLEEGAEEWKAYLAEWKKSEQELWILIEHVKEHALANFERDAAALRRWLNPG